MQRVTNWKKDGVAILLSNKLDLRAKKISKSKEVLYKMTEPISQEHITS